MTWRKQANEVWRLAYREEFARSGSAEAADAAANRAKEAFLAAKTGLTREQRIERGYDRARGDW